MKAGVAPYRTCNTKPAAENIRNIRGPGPCRPKVRRTIRNRQTVAVQLSDTLVALPGGHANDPLRLEHGFDSATVGKTTKQDLAKLIAPDRMNVYGISSR